MIKNNLNNKDKQILYNYNLTKKLFKYDNVIIVDKYTLTIYKKGIITDIKKTDGKILLSLLINNKYTLHIKTNDYYIFIKNNKTNIYKNLLNSLY